MLGSVADSARFDVFQLGEAALGRRVPRALRMLDGLRAEGVEPTLVLWSLSKAMRDIWGAARRRRRGRARWRRQAAALEKARARAPRAAVSAASRRAPRAPTA